MNDNRRYNPPSLATYALVRVALILLLLLVLSTYLMGGLWAKYHSAGGGQDSAGVAKFRVVVTGDANAVSVVYGSNDNGLYSFTVKNESEVTVTYTLRVVVDTALTGAFNSESGTLTPDAQPAEHTLSFSVNDWDAITEDMTNENPTVHCPFTVIVHVEQVD